MTAWEKCVAFHGHSCGGLTIGYKAALYAMDLLDIEFADNEQVVCISENDACGVDAIQVMLGCSIGKGNLLFHMTGKQPNGVLANGNIINYSEKELRRVDFSFSIAYDADFDKARSVIEDILKSHNLVLDDPEPFVRMSKHAASSIDIVARAWVKSDDYWTVNFDVLEKVKAEFDKNHIEIPFDQIDVHVKNS